MKFRKKYKEEIKFMVMMSLSILLGSILTIGMLFFMFGDLQYRLAENKASNDDMPTMVSKVCSRQSSFRYQVECVRDYWYTDFDYEEHFGFRLPKEMYDKGGVCRDYAVALCSTYKRMGFNCDYVFSVTDHVFVSVGNDEEFCIVNWNYADCWRN